MCDAPDDAGQPAGSQPEAVTRALRGQAGMLRMIEDNAAALDYAMDLWRENQELIAARLADIADPASPAARQYQELGRLAKQVLSASAAAQRIDDYVLDVARHITALTQNPALEQLRDWEPRNWGSLPAGETARAITLMNEGIPLVWVPRSAVVTELAAAADTEARAKVLATARDDIAEDCRIALISVTAPDLQPLAALADLTVSMLTTDFWPGAQALAANILDTWLYRAASRGVPFSAPGGGKGFYSQIKKQIGPVDDETLLTEFRSACVLAPLLAALQPFWPSSDPTPSQFTRHATSHRAGPEQYTEHNATIAVMLTVSELLRVFRTGNLRLIHAASCPFSNSSMTSCGVR
jgi:hypothetical protein